MMARMILQMSLEEGQILVVERALSTVAPWRFDSGSNGEVLPCGECHCEVGLFVQGRKLIY
jgi:hypothetical protein